MVVLTLLILLVIIVALIIFSIKYSKIGGIISMIGLVSLCITACKYLMLQVILELTGIGFPANLEKVAECSQTKEVLMTQMNALFPWIVASAVILLAGILWIIAAALKKRKQIPMC